MEAILEKAIVYTKKLFENDFSGHDFDHTHRVFRMAEHLAAEEGADLLTVRLSALLHDVDDRKLSPETSDNKDNAVSFLRENDISEEKIREIVRIIKEISFVGTDSVTPETIEGKCVQDADRLDALGAIGIARTFAYGGSHGRPLHTPEDAPQISMNQEQYEARQSGSLNHFYEKLFLLKDRMGTATGRHVAEQREAFMRQYIEKFLLEWNGEDI